MFVIVTTRTSSMAFIPRSAVNSKWPVESRYARAPLRLGPPTQRTPSKRGLDLVGPSLTRLHLGRRVMRHFKLNTRDNRARNLKRTLDKHTL
ncbi:Hypothetical protein NTJ_04338 [Nesidiocoris tenuis]|uniref:Uncharacterized protein n=1 Tax=Nesidiocoris tenuis TaxID=355587 RepID=A0ABN7AKU9_9HEMI|nr:Hypothetical protein NTJ_04338 [Nesidiocoris tenuis]